MIKKTLLSLWISIICLTWYTNAKVQEVWLLKYPSSVNQNYSIWFIKWWWVITDFIWVWKSVAWFDLSRLFWWSTNWLPYVYLKPNNSAIPTIQWFYDRYYVCNELTTIDTLPDNCTIWWYFDYSWSLENDKVFLKSFFSNVIAEDLVYYNSFEDRYGWATLTYSINWLDICWSSSEIWKSLCFRWVYCNSSSNSYCNSYNYGSLINSQNLSDLTFWNVANSRIWYAPGQAWYDWSRDNTNESTSNVVIGSCPTIAQILQNNYWSSYNTWLCYNNTTYFNWTNFETIEKDEIFTIFDDNYENYTNRISIYWNNCSSANTNQACANAFSGEYKKYSIIANAMNSNVEVKKLWNYCNLALNYDPNATTCVASGVVKEQPTQEEMLNDILNINTWIPTPWNATGTQVNNVFNSLCDPNNPDTCYWTWNIRDIFWSMQRIYWKITWLFAQRQWVKGIIPDYILRITFLIILFTIIFKK